MLRDHAGTYFTEAAGEPILNTSTNKVLVHGSIPGAQAPCCERCNRILGDRWERTASAVMRRFDASTLLSRPRLSPAETEAFTLWLTEMALLLTHPAVRHTDRTTQATVPRWSSPDPLLYGWMVTGQDPPAELSVVLCREARAASGGLLQYSLPIHETLTDPDGNVYVQRCAHIGVHELSVDLIYHPGWPTIVHPLVAAGVAVQLWPVGQFDTLDFNAIPPVHPDDCGRAVALLPAAILKVGRHDLPQLEAGVDLSPWIT